MDPILNAFLTAKDILSKRKLNINGLVVYCTKEQFIEYGGSPEQWEHLTDET